MSDLWTPTRRKFVHGAAATAAFAALPASSAFAAKFPSQKLGVMVATREGGGADRNLRLFWSVWQKYLKTKMEASFHPGAAGRVGYVKYMGLAKPDCYTHLFGNMGPEVLNWVVKPPKTFKFPGDYKYWLRVDSDPSGIFVRNESEFKSIDDLIAAGKKRTLKVAASRIAHPAVVGILALAKHTGAQVNVVPLSGGKNTYAGVKSGEFECGALPISGVSARSNAFRILCVFDDKNKIPEKTGNAPTVNAHFGTKFPPLVSARAFALKTEAINKYPDRFKILQETAKQVFSDPDFKKAVIKAKAPWELIDYGGLAECEAYVKNITAIGNEFKDLLSGMSKKKKKKS
ncbi:MAG: tripartite tricarboxylate transporter substrate-binding protein [Proteobacteria bacterium]|nr:tripartite tricarboxylate transporter substrate-binding protein [Pseudomonadota bacterium]